MMTARTSTEMSVCSRTSLRRFGPPRRPPKERTTSGSHERAPRDDQRPRATEDGLLGPGVRLGITSIASSASFGLKSFDLCRSCSSGAGYGWPSSSAGQRAPHGARMVGSGRKIQDSRFPSAIVMSTHHGRCRRGCAPSGPEQARGHGHRTATTVPRNPRTGAPRLRVRVDPNVHALPLPSPPTRTSRPMQGVRAGTDGLLFDAATPSLRFVQ